jgi:hypothetical protein
MLVEEPFVYFKEDCKWDRGANKDTIPSLNCFK